MTSRISFARRVTISIVACAVLLVSGGAALAEPEPEDEVRALLLSARNVFAAGVSPTDIFLAWETFGPLASGFRIEMALDEEGPYLEIMTTGPCSGGTKCNVLLSKFDGTPADTTVRWFRVVPLLVVGGGQTLPSTTILEGPPSLPDPAILGPRPPTNLRCNGNLACLKVQSVTLTWVDNSDEAEFWIMRARGLINPQFGTERYADVPANVTSFSDFVQEFASTFFYRVVAVRKLNIVRSDGTVTEEKSYANSQPDRVKVETPPVPAPLDPSGLSAQFIPPDVVRLTWTDTAVDEDGFFIEMGPTATEWQTMTPAKANPGVGTVTWEQTVAADTKRCYRVRAWKAGPAYSGYTDPVCLGAPPAAPSGLTATAISNSQVNLAWNDNSNAEDSFIIERCAGVCTSSSAWTKIDEQPADTTTYSDTNTVALTTYSYRVFASNASGKSAPSNIATVTTKAAPLPAPANLVATAKGSHKIELTWTDKSSDETGFRIEYKNIDGEWDTLATVGHKSGSGGTVTYLDRDSLNAKQTRCYRVRAVKGTSEVSDPSNTSCATTFAAQAPNGVPSGVTALDVKDRTLTLQWTDNATNEDSFRIEAIVFEDQHCTTRSLAGLPWTAIATAPERANTGQTSIALSGLIPHSSYYFRVVAVNLDGESAPSSPTGCVETLGPPKPVFKDPNASGDVEVTRCSVQVVAPTIQNPNDGHVARMRLIVVPTVPGGPSYDRIELFLDSTYGGPGSQEHGYVHQLDHDNDPLTPMVDVWEFEYRFRKGISYGLIATSYGPSNPGYVSVDARLRDITVLADCPTSGL